MTKELTFVRKMLCRILEQLQTNVTEGARAAEAVIQFWQKQRFYFCLAGGMVYHKEVI